jgi:hypothetical protein
MHFLCQFENIDEIGLEYQDMYGRNLVMHNYFSRKNRAVQIYTEVGGLI